jgi:hypothetical protein
VGVLAWQIVSKNLVGEYTHLRDWSKQWLNGFRFRIARARGMSLAQANSKMIRCMTKACAAVAHIATSFVPSRRSRSVDHSRHGVRKRRGVTFFGGLNQSERLVDGKSVKTEIIKLNLDKNYGILPTEIELENRVIVRVQGLRL